MDVTGAIGYAWTIIRIPVFVLFTVIWVYLSWKPKTLSSIPIEPTAPNESVQKKVPEPPSTSSSSSQPTQPASSAVLKPTSKPIKKIPKKFTRSSPPIPSSPTPSSTEYHVFFTTQFNHTSRLAKHTLSLLSPSSSHLHDLSKIPNLDDYFLQHPPNPTYLLLLPSYANDSGPSQGFLSALEETLNDFRVDANPLRGVKFAVFGTGDKEGWPLRREYCYQAARAEKLLGRLGASRIFTCGMGDSKGRVSLEGQLEGWLARVLKGSPAAAPAGNAEEEDEDDVVHQDGLLDVEDVGKPLSRNTTSNILPEMVSTTSLTYRSLTKQGYTIVGSHSGVKICRWTKSALRGRGSCYKFSFYGIKSHLCMETTPSLACANKCVFCWRHGTNPVGTTWRWQIDPPEEVYRGALEGHYAKIRMLKGMMGVKPSRYEEAQRVRHCALSLVGEPIFCTAPRSELS